MKRFNLRVIYNILLDGLRQVPVVEMTFKSHPRSPTIMTFINLYNFLVAFHGNCECILYYFWHVARHSLENQKLLHPTCLTPMPRVTQREFCNDIWCDKTMRKSYQRIKKFKCAFKYFDTDHKYDKKKDWQNAYCTLQLVHNIAWRKYCINKWWWMILWWTTTEQLQNPQNLAKRIIS